MEADIGIVPNHTLHLHVPLLPSSNHTMRPPECVACGARPTGNVRFHVAVHESHVHCDPVAGDAVGHRQDPSRAKFEMNHPPVAFPGTGAARSRATALPRGILFAMGWQKYARPSCGEKRQLFELKQRGFISD